MDNVFIDNPELEVYYKTSDGEAFYKDTDAKSYAKNLKDKTVTTVHRVGQTNEVTQSQNDMATTDTSPKLSWQEAIKAIKEAQTVEELEPFKGYTQNSVIKALEEKTSELAVNITVNAENVTVGNNNSNNE